MMADKMGVNYSSILRNWMATGSGRQEPRGPLEVDQNYLPPSRVAFL